MERIKQLRRWVCWNATPVKGRMTKVPCAAIGGATGSDEKYAHTWVTYEEAVEAMKRNGYTGVGFVIPEGVFFIDKDHIDPNDPVVQELLRRFPSYAERSYSGNGVHVFGMCDLSRIPVLNGKLDKRYYTKNPHNGLEVYIGSLTNRFAAFTDEPIQDLPLADCTDALLELLEKDMRREKEPQPVQEEIIDEAVDEDDPRIGEIIEALRWDRNAPKFVRLFDEGDITGYASQSEADAALCAIIAFRAGPNPALIDAIFRQSALYRDDKWERADYRASTIQCGIAARRGVYHHSTQVKPFFVMQNPKSGVESINNHIEKKQLPNRGELPQYAVTENHEPIIDRATFDAVQKEIRWRAAMFAPVMNADDGREECDSRKPNKPDAPAMVIPMICGICGKRYRRKITRRGTAYAAPVWICSTYNYRGKAYCASKQIPEPILLELIATVIDNRNAVEEVDHLEVHPDNRILFVFRDGHTEEHVWKDHSRKDSWNTDKRKKAAEKTRAQHQRRREREAQ